MNHKRRRIKTKILRDVTLRVASFFYRLVNVQHHALTWTRNAIPVFEERKSTVTASSKETTVARCDGH